MTYGSVGGETKQREQVLWQSEKFMKMEKFVNFGQPKKWQPEPISNPYLAVCSASRFLAERASIMIRW